MIPEDRYYKIRYGIVPVEDIFNFVGPANGSFNLPPKEALARIKVKIAFSADFYISLEESMKKDGFRNPVLVYAGWINDGRWLRCPTYIRDQEKEDVIICVSCGGSRLYIAERLRIDVPCIIVDFVGRFDHFEELTTKEEVEAKFTDAPNSIVFGRREIDIRLPKFEKDLGIDRIAAEISSTVVNSSK